MFIIPYVLIPYVFVYELFPEFVQMLSKLTIISVLTYLFALNTSFGLDFNLPKIEINFNFSIFFLFSIFLFFILIVFATAPNIPIIESFKGSSSDDLSRNRDEFLKTRVGWEASLGYIIGLINAYFLPYFISLAFQRNHKNKFLFAGLFLLFSISFLEKAYFLKLGIPIFFLFLLKSTNKIIFFIKGLGTIILLLAIMFFLTGNTGRDYDSDAELFSILYSPQGIIESIFWRSAVIPVITALDGIRVFLTDFNSQFFFGNTSSLIAFFKGSERMNFERYLYQSQFGGEGTGNANQFFVVEAYINFGIVGVILFSFFIGKFVRSLIKLNDLALVSVIPLFFFNLFNAGLIGILFSNGFLLFYIFVKFFIFDKERLISKKI
ncbi:hypothetical protein EGI24_12715 [Lacihabitans sp. CS3-21]|nr:hypothetical protein [Lacihabitans sp. CS3-21]